MEVTTAEQRERADYVPTLKAAVSHLCSSSFGCSRLACGKQSYEFHDVEYGRWE